MSKRQWPMRAGELFTVSNPISAFKDENIWHAGRELVYDGHQLEAGEVILLLSQKKSARKLYGKKRERLTIVQFLHKEDVLCWAVRQGNEKKFLKRVIL